MVELELSTIPDSEQDAVTMAALLQEFEAQTRIHVRMRRMSWGAAWPEMLTFASHGKGPDVSHIGGSWVSSLTIMNCLRPFKPVEVGRLGGSQAFLAPVWENTQQVGDPRVWSIPWTAYIYVICYRKDLFELAGVDPQTLFQTAQSLRQGLTALGASAATALPWLNPRIVPPYTDLVHQAASWVWSAGGNFMNDAGSRVMFDSPAALTGFELWLDTFRLVPETHQALGSVETVELFRQGQAVAVLTDIRVANSFVAHQAAPVVSENLGILPMGVVPWVGGGSFVVWQQVVGYSEREQAALELVKFLTGPEANLRWARGVGSMPARLEALQAIYPPENPLHAAVSQAATHGRPYRTVPLWRKIEYQLAQELQTCLQEASARPDESSSVILRARLEPLARRLNLTLGN